LQHLHRENARLASQVEGLEARIQGDVGKIAAGEKEIASLRLQVKELKAQIDWHQQAISASGDTGAGDLADRVQRTGDETEMDGAAPAASPEPLVVEKVIYVEKPVEIIIEKTIEKIVTVEKLVYVETPARQVEVKDVKLEDEVTMDLSLRVAELEAQLGVQDAANAASGAAGAGGIAALFKNIQGSVAIFFNFREKSYVQELFKRYANQDTNLMTVDTMSDALRELGIQLTRD
jgi:phage shock protein A